MSKKLIARPLAKTLPLLLPLLLGLIPVSGCNTAPQTSSLEPEAPTPEPVSTGQALFLSHCVVCHRGPGDPPGPNAIILDSERLATEERFVALLRHPVSARMTQFTPDMLSNADAHELYAYLQSLKAPPRPRKTE